eukprot:Rhum_TRINITY_DN14170_c10_g1::Rhum_TRINITY_DN14170_c10_g1_i1::g.72807::m.72807
MKLARLTDVVDEPARHVVLRHRRRRGGGAAALVRDVEAGVADERVRGKAEKHVALEVSGRERPPLVVLPLQAVGVAIGDVPQLQVVGVTLHVQPRELKRQVLAHRAHELVAPGLVVRVAAARRVRDVALAVRHLMRRLRTAEVLLVHVHVGGRGRAAGPAEAEALVRDAVVALEPHQSVSVDRLDERQRQCVAAAVHNVVLPVLQLVHLGEVVTDLQVERLPRDLQHAAAVEAPAAVLVVLVVSVRRARIVDDAHRTREVRRRIRALRRTVVGRGAGAQQQSCCGRCELHAVVGVVCVCVRRVYNEVQIL